MHTGEADVWLRIELRPHATEEIVALVLGYVSSELA